MMKEIIQTLREQSIVSDGKLRCNTLLATVKRGGHKGGGRDDIGILEKRGFIMVEAILSS